MNFSMLKRTSLLCAMLLGAILSTGCGVEMNAEQAPSDSRLTNDTLTPFAADACSVCSSKGLCCADINGQRACYSCASFIEVAPEPSRSATKVVAPDACSVCSSKGLCCADINGQRACYTCAGKHGA